MDDSSGVLEKKSFSKKDFSKLYKEMYKRVYEFVYKRIGTKEVSEDLTSDIFEKIYKSIDDFKWQGINVSAWIYRIARNRIIDYYRKSAKRRNDSSIYDLSNIIKSDEKKEDEIMLEREEYTYLYNSIREFNEEDQYLIYYKFFEELSNKEISDLTQLSETNVGTRLHRIRKKLLKIIKKFEKTG